MGPQKFTLPHNLTIPTEWPWGKSIFLYYSAIPTFPVPDHNSRMTRTKTPVFDDITLALRTFLFIACLVENSIAVFILQTQKTRNGRKTFASFMFTSIACADILTAITYYPAVFVVFSEGSFDLLVKGTIGDILCKFYNFLVNLPGNVSIFSLIALACEAIRNSSSKGRKEHNKNFSIAVTTLLWIMAAVFSAVSLGVRAIHTSYQLNECSINPLNREILPMLNAGFVASVDIVLAFLNFVVLVRVKRRGREMKMRTRERVVRRHSAKRGRRRRIGPQFVAQNDQEMQPTGTSRGGCGLEDRGAIEASQQAGPSSGPDTVIDISPAKEDEGQFGNTETTEIASKMPETNEVSNNQTKRRGHEPENGVDDMKTQGSEIVTGQSVQEESFQTTKTEAKITGAVSFLFVILSITVLILQLVCTSCNVYVFFAVGMAEEIFTVIKPGIYASAGKGFRKRYKQLSPFACCCLWRVRCQEVRMPRGANEALNQISPANQETRRGNKPGTNLGNK